MLKLLRRKEISKFIFWGLVILIIPAFVLLGSGSIGRPREKGPAFVGLIYGKKVSFEEFAMSVGSIRYQLMLTYYDQPKVLEEALKNGSFIAKMAWDRIIMAREAAVRGVKIADSEVIGHIKKHPLFLRNGKFDEKIYRYALRNHFGLEPRSFEEITRENLAMQKSNDLLTKDVKAADEDIVESYRIDNEKFKIAYVMVSSDDFLKDVKVEEGEARDYYDKQKVEFILPQEPKGDAEAPVPANFEDVKDALIAQLSEARAKAFSVKSGEETHKKLKILMENEKLSFEQASAKLGLKVRESPLFAKADYLEGIGEASRLIWMCVKLKDNEISPSVETRKGVLIFKVTENQKYDEEKFKKEKDEYSKKVLDRKKNSFLEEWLRSRELSTTINIDFEDFDKYYK